MEMARRRFIQESEGEEYLHKETWRVVQLQFERPEYSAPFFGLYDDLVAMVFAFHTLEGYLNFIGDKILPDVWEECERISIDAKLTLILRECGLSKFEKARRPYQTVVALTKLRNSIAHPKTQKPKRRTIYAVGKEPPLFPKTYLDTMVSHEKALRARDDVKYIVDRIHCAAVAKFPALHLGDDGLKGILSRHTTRDAAAHE